MFLLHFGQCEEGNTTDSSLGKRAIQTFKKLPIMLPVKKINRLTSIRGNYILAVKESQANGCKIFIKTNWSPWGI